VYVAQGGKVYEVPDEVKEIQSYLIMLVAALVILGTCCLHSSVSTRHQMLRMLIM
jgi:hypothetical protein